MSKEKSMLVYYTYRAVPRTENSSVKEPQQSAHPSERVYVLLERKARRGKTVTLIEGLQRSARDREDLLRQLKTRLGTGGTDRDGTLEIQGDHRDTIISLLRDLGYKPKRSGG
jgi:translation initiation factor 1